MASVEYKFHNAHKILIASITVLAQPQEACGNLAQLHGRPAPGHLSLFELLVTNHASPSVEMLDSPAVRCNACSIARQARSAHLTRCGNLRTPRKRRRSPNESGASSVSLVTRS